MTSADSRPVHVPPRAIESINNLVRTSQRMLHEIGRAPTTEELAHRLGMPAEKVRRILEIAGVSINEMPGAGTRDRI